MENLDLLCEFNNIYDAYRKARRNKGKKEAVKKFELNLLEEIQLISQELRAGTYQPSDYYSFKIYEPKERLIETNSFRDKVIQHDLCDNVLGPEIMPHFILDNYASQKNKGTFFALDRLTGFLRRYYRLYGSEGFILKGDIHHYFASIGHGPLKDALWKIVEDPDIRQILNKIIDSTDDPGVPIGNQTSQFFALLTLNGMDHMIKDQLGAKYYGRYMDDFYVICRTKSEAQFYLSKVREYLQIPKLELNGKTQIFPISNGIDFLGFHTYMTKSGKVVKKMRRRSIQKMRRKLHKFHDLYWAGEISKEKVTDIYTAWRSNAAHGDCHKLMNDMDILYRKVFIEKEGENDLRYKQTANQRPMAGHPDCSE